MHAHTIFFCVIRVKGDHLLLKLDTFKKPYYDLATVYSIFHCIKHLTTQTKYYFSRSTLHSV